MSFNPIEENIPQALMRTQQRINEACQASDRSPNDVMLLAVSKTKPLSHVIAAYDHGQRHFGVFMTIDAWRDTLDNTITDLWILSQFQDLSLVRLC